jgi:hypothetical protein
MVLDRKEQREEIGFLVNILHWLFCSLSPLDWAKFRKLEKEKTTVESLRYEARKARQKALKHAGS